MIEMNNRRILLVQFFFLMALSLISFLIGKSTTLSFLFYLIWLSGILLNLFFIKTYALPDYKILKKINAVSISNAPSWEEIEESLSQKEVEKLKQYENFEQENLKYKNLLDSMEDPVCIISKESMVFYANKSFLTVFQINEHSFPMPLLAITRHHEFQNFIESSIKVSQVSRLASFTFNQNQDPLKKYFDLKISPLINQNDYLCLLHDITERVMTDQIREDFVSNFSHEVRTPLTILNGQIQNLKANLEQEKSFSSSLIPIFYKIENNSKRLISLLNDLLQLSSIEFKKEINKEIVNLEEVIYFLIQDLALNYPQKNITISLELNKKEVYVEFSLFEQALINLIDNAFKYSNEIGSIKIKSYQFDNWDQIEITDSGIGIPEEQLHRIFERFFRVDSSRSFDIPGTGLGLSIVKHIIQKHNGKIKVQSRFNEGSTFILSLPSQSTSN